MLESERQAVYRERKICNHQNGSIHVSPKNCETRILETWRSNNAFVSKWSYFPLFRGPDIDAYSCIRYAAHISVVMCSRITHLKMDQPGEPAHEIVVLIAYHIFCRLLNFFQIKFFEKFFQEYYHSVTQFGSRSSPAFCRAWFGSKLIAKVCSRWH